jgi:glycosyltransferase involved in cell wall biosynthesis
VRVTAVVPLHNHKEWVCGALQSLFCQTWPLDHIIVVDDGSTDGGLNALGDLAETAYERGGPEGRRGFDLTFEGGQKATALRYEKASGPAFARNRGIEFGLPDTDVFAFLDSDDEFSPLKLEASLPYFDDPLTGVVYSDYDTLRPDGIRLRQFKEPFDRSRLLQECLINCDSLVSAAALKACGDFDENLRVAEDYDLWLRLTERFVAVHVPEALVAVRVGAHSSTDQVAKDTWNRCYARVMGKLRERCK